MAPRRKSLDLRSWAHGVAHVEALARAFGRAVAAKRWYDAANLAASIVFSASILSGWAICEHRGWDGFRSPVLDLSGIRWGRAERVTVSDEAVELALREMQKAVRTSKRGAA
jgi:hypothetical protein